MNRQSADSLATCCESTHQHQIGVKGAGKLPHQGAQKALAGIAPHDLRNLKDQMLEIAAGLDCTHGAPH
jgi:hypothetical protein